MALWRWSRRDLDRQVASNLCSILSSLALTLLTFHDVTYEEVNAFIDAIQTPPGFPKYPALTHLEFNHATCVELIGEFPAVLLTVKHLTFTSCDPTDILYDLASDDAVPWPNLETLTINPFKRESQAKQMAR
jgi:hypothetical protein